MWFVYRLTEALTFNIQSHISNTYNYSYYTFNLTVELPSKFCTSSYNTMYCINFAVSTSESLNFNNFLMEHSQEQCASHD